MRTCCNGAEKERGGKRKFCFEKKRETNARLVFSVSGGVEKNSRLGEGGSQESFFAGGLVVKMTFFTPSRHALPTYFWRRHIFLEGSG